MAEDKSISSSGQMPTGPILDRRMLDGREDLGYLPPLRQGGRSIALFTASMAGRVDLRRMTRAAGTRR